jgi:hypothetical protein
MGAPDLYRATVRVKTGAEVSDEASETFGVREISWGPNPDAPPGSADWVLFINGRREFIRGGNWVPADAMFGRLADERYETLIAMARDAGVNLLRVWGGGDRERLSPRVVGGPTLEVGRDRHHPPLVLPGKFPVGAFLADMEVRTQGHGLPLGRPQLENHTFPRRRDLNDRFIRFHLYKRLPFFEDIPYPHKPFHNFGFG